MGLFNRKPKPKGQTVEAVEPANREVTSTETAGQAWRQDWVSAPADTGMPTVAPSAQSEPAVTTTGPMAGELVLVPALTVDGLTEPMMYTQAVRFTHDPVDRLLDQWEKAIVSHMLTDPKHGEAIAVMLTRPGLTLDEWEATLTGMGPGMASADPDWTPHVDLALVDRRLALLADSAGVWALHLLIAWLMEDTDRIDLCDQVCRLHEYDLPIIRMVRTYRGQGLNAAGRPLPVDA